MNAAEPPPGEYLDQHARLDYDDLVPPGDPRRNVDMAYTRQVIMDPVLLEQIYYDATHGNQQAAWLVCELEATAHSGGRRVARHLASLRCRALGTCRAHWDELPISRDTASGQRLLSLLAAGFRKGTKRRALEDQLITNALDVIVGAHIAARTSFVGPRPSGTRPGTGVASRGSVPGTRVPTGLNLVKEPLKGLRTVRARLDFRGPANSVLRGGDVARGVNAGAKRAFVTDSQGRIVREITPDRVKVRVTNVSSSGQVFETFEKAGPQANDESLVVHYREQRCPATPVRFAFRELANPLMEHDASEQMNYVLGEIVSDPQPLPAGTRVCAPLEACDFDIA